VDLEKALDLIDGDNWWIEMSHKVISYNMVMYIRKFMMLSNSVYNVVLMCQSLLSKEKVLSYGCSLSPCLFNIFIDDALNYIGVENVHAQMMEKVLIPGLSLQMI
jgi:hypothetical protein